MRGAKKPTLLLGVPTLGMHSAFFTKNLLGMVWPTNFALQYRDINGLEVGRARNLLAQEAKAIGAKYLMFWDEDVIAPAYGAKKLIYYLDVHPDWSVVAGVYATKSIPPEPLIYRDWAGGVFWGWKVGELVEVKATGMGFTLLRVSDLDRIETTEYEDRSPWTGAALAVKNYFNTGAKDAIEPLGVDKVQWTEDIFFWRLAEKAGLRAYVDTDVLCHHYDSTRNIFYNVPIDNATAVKPDPWNHSPRICELGAGSVYDPYAVLVDLRDEPHITYRCDIRQLPSDWTEQFDVVRASHVLEHFGYGETDTILTEWLRILKPGGILELTVPDMQWAAQRILAGDMGLEVMGTIWGDQGHPFWMQPPYGGQHEGKFYPHSYENNVHRAGFTVRNLVAILRSHGLQKIEGQRGNGVINIRGQKPNNSQGDKAGVEAVKGNGD